MSNSNQKPRMSLASVIAKMADHLGIETKAPYVRKEHKEPIRKGSYPRNQKIVAQVNAMHEKWLREQFPSRVTKQEPDPNSISSIKKRHGVTRHVARMIAAKPHQ